MIHSTVGGNDASWIEPLHRSAETGNNPLENAFSSLSLSSVIGGIGSYRPPALSTSTISSFGEETTGTQNKASSPYNSDFGFGSYVHQHNSPLTSSSSSLNQFQSATVSTNNNTKKTSSFHSPGVGRFESPSSFRSSMIQTSFDEQSSRQTNFDQDFTQHHHNNPYIQIRENSNNIKKDFLDLKPVFGTNRERSSSMGSIGFNDFTDNKDEQGTHLWSHHHGGHDYSTKGKSDLTDNTGMGGFSPLENMMISPGNRSTHSLKNMGSVDENEQFLGNRGRARTMSAGTNYRSFNNGFGHEFNNSPMSVGTGVRYMKEQQQQASPTQQGHKQLQRSSHNMHYGHSNTIQENLVHSHSHARDISSMNRTIVGSRQRIMSADAVTHHNLNERSSNPIYDGHDNVLKQQIMSHSSRLHTDDGGSYNRQRSFTSPSPRQFFDSSPSFGDEGGKYYTHTQTYDNRYPVVPLMHEEAKMRMIQNHAITQQIRSSPHNRVDHHHYFQQQSNSLIAGTTSRVIYTVKFKRSQRNFILSPHIQGDIKIGTHVKVEADRGQDLGVVLSRVPIEKFNLGARGARYGCNDIPMSNTGMPEMKRIVNVATSEEITLLQIKNEEEDELLKICRGKTSQRGLPMNVVDAEYQFDRHKLTFFFEAEGRIDFRELVRELFSIYKTRIWMQQIDKNLTGSLNTSTTSQTTVASNEDSDANSSEKSNEANKPDF